MRKVLLVFLSMALVFSMLFILCSCKKQKEKTSEEIEIEFTESESISVDSSNGTAIFNDGIVKYSWKIDDWNYRGYNSKPDLYKIEDGLRTGFVVFDDNSKMADDLGLYAKEEMRKYYNLTEYQNSVNMYAGTNDTYFTDKGYFGYLTGYNDTVYEEDDSLQCNLAIVHSITDGRSSAVVAVYAQGDKETISKLHQDIIADHTFHPILEEYVDDVINSFEFVNGKKSQTETTSFTYNDAYELFKDVYSEKSHSEYIEFVESKTVELKEKIRSTKNEIMDTLKDYYKSYVYPQSNLSYDDYYKSYVLPYEQYFDSRMNMGENAQKAYLGISGILGYGGNSEGDAALLWKYVYCRNFYAELCDLKKFIS